MRTNVISELIKTAETSIMKSRHAAAIISGRKICSMATNYSLPDNKFIDIVTASTGGRPQRGGSEDNDQFLACCRADRFKGQTPSFNQLYEKYKGFDQDSQMFFHQMSPPSLIPCDSPDSRCERIIALEAADSTEGDDVSLPCRRKRYSEI